MCYVAKNVVSLLCITFDDVIMKLLLFPRTRFYDFL